MPDHCLQNQEHPCWSAENIIPPVYPLPRASMPGRTMIMSMPASFLVSRRWSGIESAPQIQDSAAEVRAKGRPTQPRCTQQQRRVRNTVALLRPFDTCRIVPVMVQVLCGSDFRILVVGLAQELALCQTASFWHVLATGVNAKRSGGTVRSRCSARRAANMVRMNHAQCKSGSRGVPFSPQARVSTCDIERRGVGRVARVQGHRPRLAFGGVPGPDPFGELSDARRCGTTGAVVNAHFAEARRMRLCRCVRLLSTGQTGCFGVRGAKRWRSSATTAAPSLRVPATPVLQPPLQNVAVPCRRCSQLAQFHLPLCFKRT